MYSSLQLFQPLCDLQAIVPQKTQFFALHNLTRSKPYANRGTIVLPLGYHIEDDSVMIAAPAVSIDAVFTFLSAAVQSPRTHDPAPSSA